MRRLFRTLLYTFGTFATMALAVSAFTYVLLTASVPDYDEDFTVAGIEQTVDVLRDSFAIPHIIGSSAADIYFAIGFAHAQDRLSQLLSTRQKANAGQLANLTIPLPNTVEDDLAAYSAGVNAWLDIVSKGWRGRGAPELLISGQTEITPWRPADSLNIAKYFLASLRLTPDELAKSGLVEDKPSENPPFLQDMITYDPRVSLDAWAVKSAQTVTGVPILVADSIGPLSLPSEWYLADLQFPTGAVMGSTLPGIPFVFVGRNDRIAWAFRSSDFPRDEALEPLQVASAVSFITILEKLPGSTDAGDAVEEASDNLPAGLEILVIDRNTSASSPQDDRSRKPSLRALRRSTLQDRQTVFSMEVVKAVQRDTVSEASRALLPLMARELWFQNPVLSSEDRNLVQLRSQVLDRLAAWNGNMDRYSPEPLAFWAWSLALQRRILKDEFPIQEQLWRLPNPEFLISALSARGESADWCDIRTSSRVETCQDQIEAALDDAVDWLNQRHGSDPSSWMWGSEHYVEMNSSTISSEGLLKEFLSLRKEISGDPYTQFSTSFDPTNDRPFVSSTGSNFQAIMSMSEDMASYFLLPAGQSGHPMSPFFDNFFQIWSQNEYLTMTSDLAAARSGSVGLSRLSPDR